MDSTGSEPLIHVFLVSFPGQGLINPLLRLGNHLASKGLLVTFSIPEFNGPNIRKANNISDDHIPVGSGVIRFEFFDDGWDLNDPKRYLNFDSYLAQLELAGKQELPRMIAKHAEEGRPVSCVINNIFIPWVSDVAESLGIPSVLLWVQSCASFSAYYHFHHSLVPFPSESEPEIDVELPFMPLLKHDEVPSYLHPTSSWSFLGRAILGQFKNLSKPFCILMDTFQELEHEIIEHMSKICPIKAVGPLFKYPKISTSNVRGDLLTADDCIEWLDSKPPSTVVYISFGSIVRLKQEQATEIAYGLLNSGLSFLWVMKPPPKELNFAPLVLPEGFLEKVGEKGKIVQWSPQEKVLAHQSVSCFVTHCGWNSTVEALTCGVPLVAFPRWGDQVTDAKFLVDVFKVGIRMSRGEGENRIISREEIENCIRDATSGPPATEIKENALKWKKAAEEAVAEGGSSYQNIQAFVEAMVGLGRTSMMVTNH